VEIVSSVKYASDNLFHFLDKAHRKNPGQQFRTFTAILKHGLRFNQANLKLGSLPGATQGAIGVPIVCFSDIPLTLTQDHADRYGSFALGFRKATVKRWGGNPVLYLVDAGDDCLRGHFTGYVKARLDEGIKRLTDPNVSDELKAEIQKWIWMLSMCKEMRDRGPHDDSETGQDRNYFEREWRVPLTDRHKTGPEGICVEHSNDFFLKIKPNDLSIIVVPEETTRADVVEWFGSSDGAAFLKSGGSGARVPPILLYEDARQF
jgi:hypothetical protein